MTDLSNRVIHSDLEMQIVARDKTVFLLFSRQLNDSDDPVPALTDNFHMSAEVALAASDKLADMAFEADAGLRMPAAIKAAKVEKHRAVLMPRCRNILNSQRENKTLTNDQLAKQLLDVFCSEVFS